MNRFVRMSAAGSLLAAALLVTASASTAATVDVDQSGTTFTPASLILQQGDTVQWNWSAGSHTVTSGTGAADPQAGVLFDTPLDSSNPTFSFVFTSAGTFPYFCRPHEGLGMTGTVTVVPHIATVTQVGTTFDPDTVTIDLGDAVTWLWTIGVHTVTSGFGSTDPGVGTIFDSPLDSSNPSFTYLFSDTAGTYPYFCRIHELFNMKGVVIVRPQTSVAEEPIGASSETTWGRVKDFFSGIAGAGR